MHLKRLIVAAVLLPLMYFYIMYLPSEYFLFLLVVIALVAVSEFYCMYKVQGVLRYAALFSAASIICVSYFSREHLWDAMIISVMAVMAIRLFFQKDPGSP